MGVRGLTTYIEENSKSYLKPHELSNCYLVVDGSSLSHSLYKFNTKTYSAFGGDYDEYYKVVKDFFLLLRKCNVKPIVMFDGGHEKRKVKTLITRYHSKLPILRSFGRGFSTAKVFPIFLLKTFVEVMEDLGIDFVRTDLEADDEIAAIARALNCPVLSYDSDFYIYDVLYIPFPSVEAKPVQFPDSNNYYIRCLMYDVKNFLNSFTGLDKSLLPILAVLLGNDYTENSLFNKLFGHIQIKKSKNKSYTQCRIHGVLNWLKKENVESAKKLILSHLENSSEKKVMNAIQTSINNYTVSCASESVINKLATRIGSISLSKKHFKISLPIELRQLYYQCQIQTFVMDIITLGLYFTHVQVEDIRQSSHHPSLQLIYDLCNILSPYMDTKQTDVKVYLMLQNSFSVIKVNPDKSRHLNGILLHNILKESNETRLSLLCKIVGVDKEELKIVSYNNWSIFIMSLIYWIKILRNNISFAHVHALILMAVVNEAVQKHVGYFINHSKFKKGKGELFQKLKGTKIETVDRRCFKEMLEGVTMYEKLLVQQNLIPFRHESKNGAGRTYCLTTVHLFNCFQSCLYHIMQINTLLNFPLPSLKISDFYSGTLLFNFYINIKAKPPAGKFGLSLLKETPNLTNIYQYLCDSLTKYLGNEFTPVKKSKKKKKQNRDKSNDFSEEELIFYKVDVDNNNDEYSDENNPYAILQNVQEH